MHLQRGGEEQPKMCVSVFINVSSCMWVPESQLIGARTRPSKHIPAWRLVREAGKPRERSLARP